jgi:signal transduction histidine kinase
MMRVSTTFRTLPRNGATWAVVLALTLGVALPAGCVIWFMAEAARNQQDAARQRVSDALQGQLRLLSERIDADWRTRLAHLQTVAKDDASEFRRLVTSGTIDSVVLHHPDGSKAYPAPLRGAPQTDAALPAEWRIAAALETSGSFNAAARQYAALAAQERLPDRAARAAQGHVRTLVRARNTAAALQALEGYLATSRLSSGRDAHGRLIVADLRLMTLRLLPLQDARFLREADRLAALVNDYDGVAMPASQRLFAMSELSRLAPAKVTLPTYAAERLAAQYLEAGEPPATDTLTATRLPDVWKARLANGGTALFRTETIARMADALLRDQHVGQGMTFALLPPGRRAGAESVAASARLPGWSLSVSPDGRADQSEGQRTTMYLWTGTLAVAGLAIAGLLLWQTFSRQMRISRLKTDLVAAVSHELRTPLASMHALVDLMIENPALERERTQEYLSMLAGENARLRRLIEHFLAFSRIERNGHTLVFRHVSPAAVIHDVAVVNRRDRFPGLVVEIASGLPQVYGDEDALATVLLNLLENAYKYTGEEKEISLAARQEAGRVVIEVKDNGIGIAWRERKRIFRPFYQVDQRLARERGGCGLGLSIVDFIVRAHGGVVTVESAPGAGSVFRVALPSRTTDREAAA